MINLITCNRCSLISYCSKDHKILHLPEHRQICTAIEKFLKDHPQWLARRFTAEEWHEEQCKFYLTVANNLGRSLEEYEIQMFVFARTCFICHQQTGLYSCKRCLSADYCLEHKKEFEEQHPSSCNILTLWLNLEISNVQYESKVSSLKFMKLPDNDGPFNDMARFIEEYVQNRKGVWYDLDYIYSDYLSGPLSVYYGMYHAKLFNVLLTKSTYIIHIIAASRIERNGLPAWEILLHLFPNIQVLIVVLIGSKLQFEFGMQEICPRCVYNGKKFIYICSCITYNDYMANPIYRRANLIIAFQVLKLRNNCIKTMQSQDCPVLLTTMSQDTALEKVAEIQNILGTDICPVIGIKNKFMSLRPYRSIKYVYCRNAFLIIYETLKNTTSEIQSNSVCSTVCI
ncbi:hypothetical protein EAI_00216 [Harpegnathos saltator]|uniref:Uncharacterized protein n=1 Tax=Harpegnathos saltator TaxID=610380 RepID=E2BP91_HARSA|nr:hypothetical protein EAI_00216 [Harpegnathos saltator]